MISKLTKALCLCAVSTPVLAGPDQISVLLGTEHINARQDFEELNPGVFLTWRESILRDSTDVSVGAFRNSYGRISVAVSAAYPLIRTEDWGFDLFSALAWYPDDGDEFDHAIGDIVPIVGVQARVGNFVVQGIPAGGQAVDATVTFGLTFRLE